MVRAVIDVGSNSVLLLVAQWDGATWTPVLETTDVTSLGEGTKVTGLLSERGMDATLSALNVAFENAERHGAESIEAAVTMAARIAKNSSEFLARAESQGTPVRILSGEDEAELGFRAVAEDPTFNAERISIIDVGGQSTELVTADRRGGDWEILYRNSFPVGTLGLRSEILVEEAPDLIARMRAVKVLDSTIGLCYLPSGAGDAVVLGATGTNLVTIRDEMTEWHPERVHGAYLDFEEVSRAASWLSSMTDTERAAVPGMERGRERTLHIGALILERFLYALRVEGCRVSVRGWRHALLERGKNDVVAP